MRILHKKLGELASRNCAVGRGIGRARRVSSSRGEFARIKKRRDAVQETTLHPILNPRALRGGREIMRAMAPKRNPVEWECCRMPAKTAASGIISLRPSL